MERCEEEIDVAAAVAAFARGNVASIERDAVLALRSTTARKHGQTQLAPTWRKSRKGEPLSSVTFGHFQPRRQKIPSVTSPLAGRTTFVVQRRGFSRVCI